MSMCKSKLMFFFFWAKPQALSEAQTSFAGDAGLIRYGDSNDLRYGKSRGALQKGGSYYGRAGKVLRYFGDIEIMPTGYDRIFSLRMIKGDIVGTSCCCSARSDHPIELDRWVACFWWFPNLPGLVNIQKTMGNHHFEWEIIIFNGKTSCLMGKLTISMAIFNSKLFDITRG